MGLGGAASPPSPTPPYYVSLTLNSSLKFKSPCRTWFFMYLQQTLVQYFFLAPGQIRCLDLIFLLFLSLVWVCLFPTRGPSLRLFTLKSLQNIGKCSMFAISRSCAATFYNKWHFWCAIFDKFFPNCHVWVHTRWSILEGLHVCQCLPNIGKTNTCAGS